MEKEESDYDYYGIQGGAGSFNDQAINEYLSKNKIKKAEVKYLHTTKRVLDYLEKDKINYGLFAVSNSRGGIVEESIYEMGKHRFVVVKIINVDIQHYMMVKPGTKIKDIKKIYAHPQVFRQCEQTLKKKYPYLELLSGEGDVIDNAKTAEYLKDGKWGSDVAVVGSKRLAEIYRLEIVDSNLQDDPHNTTNFLLVEK